MTEDRHLDLYNSYFRVIRADMDVLRAEVYRLRFQVYAVEHSFERAEDFPDGMERDAFDDQSLHTLLIHVPTGSIAGTVRLILPTVAGSARNLPIEHVCTEPLLLDDAAGVTRLANLVIHVAAVAVLAWRGYLAVAADYRRLELLAAGFIAVCAFGALVRADAAVVAGLCAGYLAVAADCGHVFSWRLLAASLISARLVPASAGLVPPGLVAGDRRGVILQSGRQIRAAVVAHLFAVGAVRLVRPVEYLADVVGLRAAINIAADERAAFLEDAVLLLELAGLPLELK